MTGKTRTTLLSFTIIAVIIFSAFGPTIAYADGGTPTEPPPVEATSQPEEASTAETTSESTEVTPEATAAAEEAAVPEEATPAESGGDESEPTPEATASEATEPTPTEEAAPVEEEAAPTEEAAPVTEETAPVQEEPVLAEVPENTTVTVIDENGEAQPLASQAAAEAIAASDPIWCAAGVTTPTPGAAGCTGSFPSFTELLTFLATNAADPAYQGAGTIYVEQGAYQGSDPDGVIDFNAYTLPNISSANLTISGGWNPSSGAVDPANTSNFTNTQIIIGSATNPWGGSLTINNLNLSFPNGNGDIVVPAENGLTLYSAGTVTVSNVTVTNAPSNGAVIDAGGNVNVVNSRFERNQETGANIRSGATVNVVNSSFSSPENARRQDNGLMIDAAGSVNLFDVIADQNRMVGTHINSGGSVTIGGTAGTGGSVFSNTMNVLGEEFFGYGLHVVAPGNVSLINVTGNNNFLWGAKIEAGGNIAIADSVFNNNTTESPGFIDDTGLFITGGGNVAINNVTADNNRLFGAQIDAVGTVSINDSSFSNNRGVTEDATGTTHHGHGLQITTLADIFLNNVTADNNSLFGGQLNAGGEVAIAGGSFSNTSTGDNAAALGKGLDIISAGDVSLSAVTANDNDTDGAAVQGVCTNLDGGTYSGNGQYGINLGNSALNLISSPTFANNGAGDIFPENPPTCGGVAVAPTTTTTSAAVTNVFTSLQVAPKATATGSSSNTSSGGVSLTEFMKGNGIAFGSIFFGQYAYLDSSSGLQVVALAPASDTLAMD
ncbi:MAG TPA: hypothetical protein VK897_14805 [Anaerolineales bacterium]|nr:hypothetical protein [Anaerolineales bacterium]